MGMPGGPAGAPAPSPREVCGPSRRSPARVRTSCQPQFHQFRASENSFWAGPNVRPFTVSEYVTARRWFSCLSCGHSRYTERRSPPVLVTMYAQIFLHTIAGTAARLRAAEAAGWSIKIAIAPGQSIPPRASSATQCLPGRHAPAEAANVEVWGAAGEAIVSSPSNPGTPAPLHRKQADRSHGGLAVQVLQGGDEGVACEPTPGRALQACNIACPPSPPAPAADSMSLQPSLTVKVPKCPPSVNRLRAAASHWQSLAAAVEARTPLETVASTLTSVAGQSLARMSFASCCLTDSGARSFDPMPRSSEEAAIATARSYSRGACCCRPSAADSAGIQ